MSHSWISAALCSRQVFLNVTPRTFLRPKKCRASRVGLIPACSLEVLAQLGEEPADLRDAALLCLLYAFALRASEIVALDWQQLDSGRGWLAVAADRVEIVLLGSKACQRRAHV
jgi:site-specific recombinase XerC